MINNFIRSLIIPAIMGVSPILVIYTAPAYSDESDCIYEFNNAFATNESAIGTLQLAQKQLSEDLIEPAKKAYQQAQSLFEEAIEHYRSLPDVAYDCSPANLTIAKNNIRTAQENLDLIQESVLGLECLKDLSEVDALTSLASDYYYQNNDLLSSETAAKDALALADSIRKKNICIGEYEADLNAQQTLAQRTINALKGKVKFNHCQQDLEAVFGSQEQAKMSAFSNKPLQIQQTWQEVSRKAADALAANHCEGIYITQLKNAKNTADNKLKKQGK